MTNPDRQKGRGMKVIYSDVKKFAIEKGLLIYQPEKVKDNVDFINTIKELNPDIICVVAYGKILPKEILDIPQKGCINLHASLLPKYRGAAPIQWSILNGDKITGVSTMYMNEKMDEGDIILQKETNIEKYETTGELWDRLSKLGADLLLETVKLVEDNKAPRRKQDNNFSLAPMLDRSMAKIDFNEDIDKIKNKIYGLNPIMGAYAMYEGKKIKFWKVEIFDYEVSNKYFEKEKIENMSSGTILLANDKIGLYIKAKNGYLKVLEMQGENSKRMSACDFLRGNKLEERT